MISISATNAWRTAFPGAMIGLLELSGVDNTAPNPQLNQHKRETEERLHSDYAGFTRKEFLSLPVMAAYERYYRRFEKTYHVLLQVESIVMKGKNFPEVSPLVDSVFTAEMQTFVLTAGHDVDYLVEPVVIDVSSADDRLTQMSGETRLIRAGDMVMRDHLGLCCSILYGQDNRSPITTATRRVLYVSYAPVGVPASVVEAHLSQIEQNVGLFSPRARTEQNWLLAS